MKIDKEMSKKLVYYALINIAVLVVVFGAIALGYGFFTASSGKSTAEKMIIDYSNQLRTYSYSTLYDGATSEGKPDIEALNNGTISYGIYVKDVDGKYTFYSRDQVLMDEQPSIVGTLNKVQSEQVGSYKYYTLAQEIESSNGNYIKLFMSAELVSNMTADHRVGSILCGLIFVLLAVVVSIILGYIELKPLMVAYTKQKNFIDDMSHEIRTPLAVIKGNIENVLADTHGDQAALKSMLETCLGEVDHMNNLSAGLLGIVRGAGNKRTKDAVMSDVVTEIVDMYAEYVAMSSKALIASVEHCDIKVDKEKVKQLINIIIENAVKYTEDGDRIHVKLKSHKDGCTLIIADSGIGVPHGELGQLFDRFYRATNTTNIEGTGLGLSIAKSIVESMNGTIKATSNSPRGLSIVMEFKRG